MNFLEKLLALLSKKTEVKEEKFRTSLLSTWKVEGFKPGQIITCTVKEPEQGGYSVLVSTKYYDDLPGYLETDQSFKPGDEVKVKFHCIDKNRMFLLLP